MKPMGNLLYDVARSAAGWAGGQQTSASSLQQYRHTTLPKRGSNKKPIKLFFRTYKELLAASQRKLCH